MPDRDGAPAETQPHRPKPDTVRPAFEVQAHQRGHLPGRFVTHMPASTRPEVQSVTVRPVAVLRTHPHRTRPPELLGQQTGVRPSPPPDAAPRAPPHYDQSIPNVPDARRVHHGMPPQSTGSWPPSWTQAPTAAPGTGQD